MRNTMVFTWGKIGVLISASFPSRSALRPRRGRRNRFCLGTWLMSLDGVRCVRQARPIPGPHGRFGARGRGQDEERPDLPINSAAQRDFVTPVFGAHPEGLEVQGDVGIGAPHMV